MTLPIFAMSIFLFLQALVAPIPQESKTGSIEGTVVRIGTGEPVSARVIFTRSPAVPIPGGPPVVVVGPPPSPRYVATDEQGKFIIKDVDPGSYRVTVVANGYAGQEYGQRVQGGQGTPVIVVAGQAVKDVGFRLTPTGNVNGRLSDATGAPIAGVQVQLFRASYNAGGQKSYQNAGTVQTNDRGEYRLFWITPGRYYVVAGGSNGLFALSPGGGVGGSTNGMRELYGPTYYPGVADLKEAVQVEVHAGEDTNAIDFRSPRQGVYHIRGRIIDSRTGERPAAVTLSLSSRAFTGGGAVVNFSTAYDPATGTFELSDNPPGTYMVGVQIQEPGQPVASLIGGTRPSAQALVTVTNADANGIVLTIFESVSIPGRITVEGLDPASTPGLNLMRVRLATFPASSFVSGPTPQAQPINADGTFREDNVTRGSYRVTVAPLPPGYFVKEVRFDQVEALNQPLLFSGTVAAPIEVLLSAKAGQLDGTVMNARQQPSSEVQVVLIPDRNQDRIELYKTATTDTNGHFTIRSIEPGEYKVFAWEALEPFSYFDSDLMRTIESMGKPVRVSESDKLTVELKVIPSPAP